MAGFLLGLHVCVEAICNAQCVSAVIALHHVQFQYGTDFIHWLSLAVF